MKKTTYDPLTALMELYQDRKVASREVDRSALTVEERLKQRIIDGDRIGLDDDLAEALRSHPPLTIINTFLLDGMKVVGELFGSGQMQLPFVLQSAETMKAAVAYLEPHMEKSENRARGTMVIATVKGDVHDIGKNLVDIILTNNGYRVVNLGIKVPIDRMLEAVTEHSADALGMSGLLVKSTLVMKENLQIMRDREIDVPVVLGGAALNRRYVEGDLREIYGDRLAYAEDAFDGLRFMDRLAAGEDLTIPKSAAALMNGETDEEEGPAIPGATRGGALAFGPLDDPHDLDHLIEIAGGSWFALDGGSNLHGRIVHLDEVTVGGALVRDLPDGAALFDPVGMIPEQARTGGLKDLLHGAVALARKENREREVLLPVDPDDRRRLLLFRSLGFLPLPDDEREGMAPRLSGLTPTGGADPIFLHARPDIGLDRDDEVTEIPERSDVAILDGTPQPPFWGSRIVENIDLEKVFEYVNEVALFRGQWGIRKGNRSAEEYRDEIEGTIRPKFEELKLRMRREKLLTPKVIYGYFPVRAEAESIVVYRPADLQGDALHAEWGLPPTTDLDPAGLVPWHSFTFPRQRSGRYLTLADFIRPADHDGFDVMPIQIVTVGSEASAYAAKLFAGNEYTDYLFTHGLSVETAEALAEYWHRSVRIELGIAGEDAEDIRRLFSQGYRGSRYSFGYPACPDLEDQRQIFEILRPERIGITLTEEFMLEPEQSTSAIIIHHPEAKYFSV